MATSRQTRSPTRCSTRSRATTCRPAPLLRLIAARRFDLYDDPMPDLASFEGYAGETVSVLYQLAAMILNGGGPVETGDAAGHLGVAHALIGHLRAFGYNASQGRIFLPWSVFAANGVDARRDLRRHRQRGPARGACADCRHGWRPPGQGRRPRSTRLAAAARARHLPSVRRAPVRPRRARRRSASQPFAAPR